MRQRPPCKIRTATIDECPLCVVRVERSKRVDLNRLRNCQHIFKFNTLVPDSAVHLRMLQQKLDSARIDGTPSRKILACIVEQTLFARKSSMLKLGVQHGCLTSDRSSSEVIICADMGRKDPPFMHCQVVKPAVF